MAGSSRYAPLNPSSGEIWIPARTPGPLGINDQGDPNVTTLLGDTPGPLGLNDYADPNLPRIGDWYNSPGIFRTMPDGNTVAMGSDALTCRDDWVLGQATMTFISVEEAQKWALQITTVFEGGKSMNYQALADDFDGQGTSFGLIQWNFGQNTLGPLLNKMRKQNPSAFANCFSTEADYETLKTALVANHQSSQIKWARDTIKNHRKAWSSAFKNIGAVDEFNTIQRHEAAAKYHPLIVKVINKLRQISPDLLTNIEFRSYAALFDLCVQQSSIDKAYQGIKTRVDIEKPKSQKELMVIAVTERGRTASAKWAADCVSRRRGILQGRAFSATEHDITVKRENDQYLLIAEIGDQYVAGL